MEQEPVLDEVNFWEAGFLHRNNRSKYGLRAASDQLLFKVNGMSDSEDDYSSYYSYSESESDYSYSDYSDYSKKPRRSRRRRPLLL